MTSGLLVIFTNMKWFSHDSLCYCTVLYSYFHSVWHRWLHFALSSSSLVLGEPPEDLRLHLCLHHARPHHHHLLRLNDPPPEECAHAVWLQGEGPQPPAHHPNGPGGGGGFHRLLDADPHLRHHQGPGDHSQLSPADRHLAFLHRPRLHQQLSQPSALRLLGWELQALFPRVLYSQSVRAGPPELHTHQERPARGPVQRPHGGQDESAGMTSHGNVITGVPMPAQCWHELGCHAGHHRCLTPSPIGAAVEVEPL